MRDYRQKRTIQVLIISEATTDRYLDILFCFTMLLVFTAFCGIAHGILVDIICNNSKD